MSFPNESLLALRRVAGYLAPLMLSLFMLTPTTLEAREFDSTIPLKVFVRGRGDAPDRVIGFTPARPNHPILIQEAALWYVRPVGPLSDTQLIRIADLLQSRKVPGLDLSDHWELSNASLQPFRTLTHLRMLNISKTAISDAGVLSLKSHHHLAVLMLPPGITDHALAVLSSLPALRELHLNRTHITDKGMILVVASAKLEDLDLRDTNVTDAGMVSLGQLAQLNHLALGRMITDGCASALRALTRLNEIDISQTEMGIQGLSALASLPGLRTVYLNPTTSDAGLAALARSHSLRDLDLTQAAITDAGVQSLAALKTLEAISFSQTLIGNESLPSLAKLSGLRLLDLSDTQVTSSGLLPLARLAKLEILSLSWVKLTREDLLAMSRLKQLRTIILNGVPLADETMAQLRRLGAPNPWDKMPGLERALLTKPQMEDPSSLAAPVPLPGSTLSSRAFSKIQTPAMKPAKSWESQHPAAEETPLPELASRAAPRKIGMTKVKGPEHTGSLLSGESEPAAPAPEAIGVVPSKTATLDEDSLLRVIALRSNPGRAGAFSGLSGLQQARPMGPSDSIDSIAPMGEPRTIAVEEDKPDQSLGEISVQAGHDR